MPRYRVQVAVSGTETYVVEAASEDAAYDDWYDGEQVGYFDGHSYDVIDVEEIGD